MQVWPWIVRTSAPGGSSEPPDRGATTRHCDIRDVGVSPKGLRGWVKPAKVDRGQGGSGALTGDEMEELRRLRRENRELCLLGECWHRPAAEHPQGLIIGYVAPAESVYPAALRALTQVLGGARG